MVVVSTVIFIYISRATPPPSDEKIALYTYRKELITMGTENVVWYKDYRYQIVLLLACIGVLTGIFW